MVKNNKGFSLIELLIVVAIIFILASMSLVTFNMANNQKPQRTMDNLMSYTKYSKSLLKSGSKDYCMAIMKGTDDNYYVFQGTASGSDMNALRSSFKSRATQVNTQVDADTSEERKIMRNNPDNGYTLTELMSDPDSAEDFENLGKNVKIYYKDQEIESGADKAVIIKFRKFDGSVISGDGKYSFSKYRSSEIKCSVILEKSTGAFHK